jgi:hypothetical protein
MSMPWSSTSPCGVDSKVRRASLPSTESRTLITYASKSPGIQMPAANKGTAAKQAGEHSDERDRVGVYAVLGEGDQDAPDQRRIDPLGHEIRGALIVRFEYETLDSLSRSLVGDIKRVRRNAAAQLLDVGFEVIDFELLDCAPFDEIPRDLQERLFGFAGAGQRLVETEDRRALRSRIVDEGLACVHRPGQVFDDPLIDDGIPRQGEYRFAVGLQHCPIEALPRRSRFLHPANRKALDELLREPIDLLHAGGKLDPDFAGPAARPRQIHDLMFGGIQSGISNAGLELADLPVRLGQCPEMAFEQR